MINSPIEVQPPQEFAAYANQVELRLAALEQELTQLKAGMTDPARSQKNSLGGWKCPAAVPIIPCLKMQYDMDKNGETVLNNRLRLSKCMF